MTPQGYSEQWFNDLCSSSNSLVYHKNILSKEKSSKQLIITITLYVLQYKKKIKHVYYQSYITHAWVLLFPF